AAGAADAARALAHWAATDVILDRPQVLTRLLKAFRTVGADGALQVLLARDPVGRGNFDDLWEAAALLAELRAADDGDAVRALLARDPARSGHIDYADSVAWLLAELRAARADEVMAGEVMAGEALADAAVRTLLARDPARHADLYEPQAVGRLAAELRAAGDVEAVRTLATRVADGIPPDDPEFLAEWLEEFLEAGAVEAVPILLAAAPASQIRLDHPGHVAWLIEELHAAGAGAGAGAGAAAGDAVRTLLDRDPGGQADLDRPPDIARLLRALRAVGAGDSVTALAARAAESASLENPQDTAWLLAELQQCGADDAVRALLARDPVARVTLDPGQQRGVTRLLRALRAADAGEAARALAARAANAGMFGLEEDWVGYRFGREPDGTPAPPWHWVVPPLAS
ncbi:MAG TPA: hypothetical protein VGI96_43000, partial [Streptosporangiaceae bacterium]